MVLWYVACTKKIDPKNRYIFWWFVHNFDDVSWNPWTRYNKKIGRRLGKISNKEHKIIKATYWKKNIKKKKE